MPLAWAACRMLQCVFSAGLRESVRLSKAAICSSAILRGRPGRNSSYSPAKRCWTKRCRHLPTVALAQRKRRAIWVLLCPSADHGTSLARATRACDLTPNSGFAFALEGDELNHRGLPVAYVPYIC